MLEEQIQDHPRVFISYSHDSPDHADRVLKLSDNLCAWGIDTILDQYESHPPEGWPRWMDKQIRDADFVLMVCTKLYYRRVMGEEKSQKGLGVRWEGSLIYQHIYNEATTNKRFIPILFGDDNVENIPTPLQGVTHYHVDPSSVDEALYRRLTHQPVCSKPELGKLKSLPARNRHQRFISSHKNQQTGDQVKSWWETWQAKIASIVLVLTFVTLVLDIPKKVLDLVPSRNHSLMEIQTLAGVVWDDNNDPLSGVSVVLPEFNLKTVTDHHGMFKFEVKAKKQRSVNLVGSKLGFETYDADPTLGNTSLNFKMRRKKNE